MQATVTSSTPTSFAGSTPNAARRRTPHLTPRQREVLALLCSGLSNKLISRQLQIAPATVKVHVGDILREMGAASRLQAVVMAHDLGLVPPFDAGQSAETMFGAGRASGMDVHTRQ